MEQDRQDLLIEEALRWLVLLRDDQATGQDREAFAAWLAAGPAHEAAWGRAQHVWSHAGIIEPAIRAGRQGAGPNVAHLPPPRRLSRRRWMGGAMAAGVLALAGGYVLSRPATFADYRTGIGERRTVTLADGSVVELGSATAMSVAFDEGGRTVTLHEGEAFFTVAADTARPFVVAAANGRTRALGTAFNVKRLPDAVIVSVAEHTVAVTANGDRPVEVETGRQARYGPDGVEPATAADLGAVQAWRRDRLVFLDAPLGDVVADLERYRRGRIVVTDRRIGALPVTAVIDVRETDAALRTIADTLPVRVRRMTDLLVLLSPAG